MVNINPTDDDDLKIPEFLRRPQVAVVPPGAAAPEAPPAAPPAPVVPTEVPPAQYDIGDLTAKYVKLRDKIAEKAAELETAMKPYKEAKAKLDAILMTHLQQQNVKGMKTDGGTLSLLDKTSFSVEDGSAFRDYVIGCQLWDLVDFTPDKSAVEAWLEKYKQLPPGVKMSTFQSLGVRRPSEK